MYDRRIRLLQIIGPTGAGPLTAKLGDKVRLKAGGHAGQRGTVAAVRGDRLRVRLDDATRGLWVPAATVTNYSLAARKAWVTGPDRPVGRHKGTKLCDRVSVTLRIDRDLWARFRDLEAAGLIENRTAAVNRWLREKVDELRDGGKRRLATGRA
jgi:hypothetical protein